MIFGQMRETAGTSEFNSIAFLVQQMIGQTNTATVVQVKAVSNAGELSPVGTVDVQPLVHQVDGIGQTVPHGVIHGIPYFRLQGGANAVILDPQVGDLGICVFSSRDISHVKASKQASPPGSYRKYSMADGLYIGGILKHAPALLAFCAPTDRKSTRLNSSHIPLSRMPSSA